MPGSAFFDTNTLIVFCLERPPRRGLLGALPLAEPPEKNDAGMIYREVRTTLFRIIFCEEYWGNYG